LVKPKDKKATLKTPSLETSTEKDEAWRELVTIFFSKSSTNEEIADAGYRLSWHFPSVSSDLQDFFKLQLNELSDFQLIRILEALDMLLEENAESAAELIVDLLSYKANICSHIENLLKSRKIPAKVREAAIQVIEVINQEFNEELRKEVDAL
jgi:predicted nuclease with TOPRIM domain